MASLMTALLLVLAADSSALHLFDSCARSILCLVKGYCNRAERGLSACSTAQW
jgi:hypothetical protein